MKKLLLLLLVACSGSVMAQTFNNYYTYAPNNNSSNYSAPVSHECSYGGYLMAWNEYGYDQPFITKTDASGIPVWTKKFTSLGMPITNVTIADVGELSWGGCYVFGWGQHPTWQMAQIYFIIWLGPSGNPLWTKTYTITESAYSSPRIHQLANGDFAIMMSSMDGATLMRTDPYGTPLWTKSYAGDTMNGKNPGFDTRPCADGGFLTSGKSDVNAFVVKTSAAGQMQWSKVYNTGHYTHPRTILNTSDGNFIMAGLQDFTGYAMKIDQSGNILWHKEYNDQMGYGFTFERAEELSNGDVIFTGGYMNGMSACARTDANGNVISSQYINDYQLLTYGASSIRKTSSEELLIAGIHSGNPYYTPFMMLTNGQGNLGCNATSMGLAATSITPTTNVFSSSVYEITKSVMLDSVIVTASSVMLTPAEYCMVTSVAQTSANSDVKVFPNPSNGETMITLPDGITSGVLVTVHDIAGRIVKQEAFDANAGSELRLSTHGLGAGAYMIRIANGNELIGTSKLMIE